MVPVSGTVWRLGSVGFWVGLPRQFLLLHFDIVGLVKSARSDAKRSALRRSNAAQDRPRPAGRAAKVDLQNVSERARLRHPSAQEKNRATRAPTICFRGLLGRLGRLASSRLALTLRAIPSLWLRLRRRGIAENLTSDRIAETVCRGLLSSELLRHICSITGVLINGSIRTECLIAKSL